MQKELVKCREEEIPKYVKKSEKRIKSEKGKEREFRRETSAFAGVEEETLELINKCYKNDKLAMKLKLIVKNELDLKQLEKYLKLNYTTIKNCFTYLAAMS